MSGRDPDAVLEELGRQLRDGFAAADRAPWWRRALARRRALRPLLLGLLLAGGASTALATRDVLRAPAIPAPPPVPGALAPDRSTLPTYVARGTADGVAWRLSASSCAYGGVRVVAAFLEVPGGGGGTRCDVAAASRPPAALAARRVLSYYDPVGDRTWVFGVLPAAARSATVTVPSGVRVTVATGPVDVRGATGAGLDRTARVLVAVVPGAVTTFRVRVADGASHPVLSCPSRSCS